MGEEFVEFTVLDRGVGVGEADRTTIKVLDRRRILSITRDYYQDKDGQMWDILRINDHLLGHILVPSWQVDRFLLGRANEHLPERNVRWYTFKQKDG